jgi:hypothetical protein
VSFQLNNDSNIGVALNRLNAGNNGAQIFHVYRLAICRNNNDVEFVFNNLVNTCLVVVGCFNCDANTPVNKPVQNASRVASREMFMNDEMTRS